MGRSISTTPERAGSRFSDLTNIHGGVLAGVLAWTLIGLAAQLHVVLYDSLVNAVDLLFDDAYYYLGVAWNLAHNHASRFAEPLSTNGYHPLWLLILAGIAALFDLSKQGLFMAALILTAVVQCAGYCLFEYRQPDAWRRTVGRLALLIASIKYPFVFSSGLETTLFIVLIPWVLRSAKGRDSDDGRAGRLGLLMSLLFLARLDALALDVAVLGVAYVTRRLTIRQIGLALLPIFATMIIYALVNQYFFGTPIPVSGQAKAIGSRFAANLGTSLEFLASMRWVAAMLIVWAIARFTVAPKLESGTFELASLAIATVTCALYYGTLSGWPIWPWYLYPNAYLAVYATIAAGLGLLAFVNAGHDALRTHPALVRVYRATVRLVALGAAAAYLGPAVANATLVNDHLMSYFLHRDTRISENSSFNQQNVLLIPWLTTHYPAGATIVMGDRAGGLGYWMPNQFSMLQSEGLVADKPFLAELKAGTLISYMDRMHADIYISDRPRNIDYEGVLGFVEPVQPKVTTGALNVLCFKQGDELLSQHYAWGNDPQQRLIYDARRRVECPAELLNDLRRRQSTYNGIRYYSGFRVG